MSNTKKRNSPIVLARVVEPTIETFEEPSSIEPELTEEPSPDALVPVIPELEPTSTLPTVTLDKYMQLFSDHIHLKDENANLRRKIIRLEEDMKRLRDKKATKKSKIEGEQLKNEIIDMILRSDLNIQSVPDSVERELYAFILDFLSGSGAPGCFRKLFTCS
jgi:hypothetical protein